MKKSGIVACILAMAMMIALLVNPARYAQSVYEGMLLYALSVMPSMLPFFFLSGIMTGTGVASLCAKAKGFDRIFHAPNAGLYVLVLSLMSGYPVGAKLTAELYEQGVIDREGASRMVSFTQATGPMFVLGSVGSAILHDYRAGLCILCAHYLATIANGLLWRGRKKASIGATVTVVASDKLLWDAAYNTVISLFVAGVFIVSFNLFADALDDIGAIGLWAKALSALGLEQSLGTAIGYGLCEMTRGCVAVAALSLPVGQSAPLCCLLVTLGGLCVALQSIAYLAKCGVKAKRYLACKITQAGMAWAFCSLFCLLL